MQDDFDENADLLIPGEDDPDEDPDDEDDVPVRLLNDFAVYSADTLVLVSIAELLQLEYSQKAYRASGVVRPWIDPESDSSDIDNDPDDDSDVISENGRDRISLSDVLEFNIHAQSEGKYRVDP